MEHSEDGDSRVCESNRVLGTHRTHFVDLVSQPADATASIAVPPPVTPSTSSMTEEEERELAELMDELGD